MFIKLCRREREIVEHSFVECSKANMLWVEVASVDSLGLLYFVVIFCGEFEVVTWKALAEPSLIKLMETKWSWEVLLETLVEGWWWLSRKSWMEGWICFDWSIGSSFWPKTSVFEGSNPVLGEIWFLGVGSCYFGRNSWLDD